MSDNDFTHPWATRILEVRSDGSSVSLIVIDAGGLLGLRFTLGLPGVYHRGP